MPMTVVADPAIVQHELRHYVEIRTTTPFRGMFAVITDLLKELRGWVKVRDLQDLGPFLVRYYVIDMDGEMDIGVGFVVPSPVSGDERVGSAVLPAGAYASVTYRGSDLQAVRTLLGWSQENEVRWDAGPGARGEVFGCRHEAYLTDYRVEPRKKQWDVEFAVKLDESPTH